MPLAALFLGLSTTDHILEPFPGTSEFPLS